MALVHVAAADRSRREQCRQRREFKAGELLQLGGDPARLLTVIDHVGKRRLLSIPHLQAKRVRSWCAWLLRVGDGQYLSNVGEGKFTSPSDAEQSPTADNPAIARLDAEGDQRRMNKSVEQQELKQSEHHGEEQGSFGMCEEIYDGRPHDGEEDQNQDLGRVAKRREIEFGAAVHPGRDYNFRILGSGHVGGIGLEGRGSGCALRVAQKNWRRFCG